MSTDDFPCPTCGSTMSKTDRYCRNCGATITEPPTAMPTAPPPPQPAPEAPPYERKFSTLQRYYRLVTAPSEAMKDIALAPDYTGYLGILAAQSVLALIAITMVLQKIQLEGTYAAQITSMLSGILVAAVFIALILLVIKWLVKSLIVRYAGDSGSSWSFNTAASVTAYAYTTDIIAIQQMNDYRAQLSLLKLTFTLPFNLLGIIWKSYLGGLGTHFGTNENCSKLTGFIIFFVLSLIGLLISFLTNP